MESWWRDQHHFSEQKILGISAIVVDVVVVADVVIVVSVIVVVVVNVTDIVAIVAMKA